MGKNLTLLLGNEPSTFDDVDEIVTKTRQGSVTWVPEEERLTLRGVITSNAEYVPPEGYYGFHAVRVSVANGSTEWEEDDEGNIRLITRDPGGRSEVEGCDGASLEGYIGDELYWYHTDADGRYMRDRLPTRLEIVSPPRKLVYEHGEAIDYSSLKVRLLFGDGTIMGTYDSSYVIGCVGTVFFLQESAIFEQNSYEADVKIQYLLQSHTRVLEATFEITRSQE